MSLIQTTYDDIRDKLRQGDIVAFSGSGVFSTIIKAATFSPISHIGIVMETKMSVDGDTQDGRIVFLLESTTLYKNKDTGKNEKGIFERRMSDRVAEYKGSVWVLPLADRIREQVDWAKFFDICWRQRGLGYNMAGAIIAGLPIPVPSFWTKNKFCSQVACYALKEAGVKQLQKVLPESVNPEELCAMDLYTDCYYQIKGKQRDIPHYNSLAPWLANV